MLHHFHGRPSSWRLTGPEWKVCLRDARERFLDCCYFVVGDQQNGFEYWNSSCHAVSGPVAAVPFLELSGGPRPDQSHRSGP